MPYSKVKLAEMTATGEEYIDIDGIAERFGVVPRTVERLIEVYAKKLKKSRKRQGRKILYKWADLLKYAKIYNKVENDDTPSVAIKRAYTKQRVKELEAENERLKKEVDMQRQEQVTCKCEQNILEIDCREINQERAVYEKRRIYD